LNSKLIPFGTLIKPHGLKGFISCRFFNEESTVLNKDSKIYFDNNINNFLIIELINYKAKSCLVKFFDISDRNGIDRYRNNVFYIDKNTLPSLLNNENYFIDFIGSTLFDYKEKEMGIVVDIVPIKDNDVLIFNGIEGEKMVPFAKNLIMFFDKNRKKLVMDINRDSIH
tara:strand:- start:790 stop:1296 length:507 start_codon:yes stop_codon:yes gene_type:complete